MPCSDTTNNIENSSKIKLLGEFFNFLKESKLLQIGIDVDRLPKNWVTKEDALILLNHINDTSSCTEAINLNSSIALSSTKSVVSSEVVKLINCYFSGHYLGVIHKDKVILGDSPQLEKPLKQLL